MQMPATHCLCVENFLVRKYGTIEKALEQTAEDIQVGHDRCINQLKDIINKEMKDSAAAAALEEQLRKEGI
jgi:hypothetical protein